MTDKSAEPRSDPLAPPEDTVAKTGRKLANPKRKKPGPYRVPPRSQRHGLFILNTGNGKGKTTAALGLLLRAIGRGMRAGMFQFVKRTTDGGEHRAASRLGVEIIPLGHGCMRRGASAVDDRARAADGWAKCRALLAEGAYDVLILDELTFPVHRGWIDEPAVLAAIAGRPPGTHVVVTGRSASEKMTEAADLVTDMRMVKHAYHDRGLRAQAGIDV